MTNEQKKELGLEILTNMDLTKEQYLELCKMCDDLDLDRITPEPEEPSWDDVIQQAENR